MLRLVKFDHYYPRQGDVEGMAVLEDESWNELQELIKSERQIYFGEILGKHSSVWYTFNAKDFEVLTEDQEWLEKAGQIGVNLDHGYFPLDYLGEEE